jgi:Na+/phosphate symporter
VRRLILALLAAAMVWVMVATWGSIGSAVMGMGLLTMGSGLLYQRFLNRDESDFSE